MRDQTLSAFLDQLADRIPAPGGGATAALHGAQAAALVGMVARYSGGERAGDNAAEVAGIRAESDRLRARFLNLAEADAAAFTAVIEAYRLPKNTAAEKADRANTIAAALADAAEPAAQTIDAAAAVLDLAEQLLPLSNPTVRTDVAIASESARAAAASARVNLEINLGGIHDPARAGAFRASLDVVPAIWSRADKVTSAVREELSA